VVGRHTARVTKVGVTASRGQLSGCEVRGETNKHSSQNLYLHYLQRDHLVEAKSSGDGVRDLGDVLGGEVDKGVFVLTSVGPGTPLPLGGVEGERERIGVQRGCGGITGSGGNREGLDRSLGERTGREQGMSGITWFAH
jgi:hypothetical protein